MNNLALNGVPLGDLNRDGLDLLDDATLQIYAVHYAHHGSENEYRYFQLLTQIRDIYQHHSARELVELFRSSIPFPSYPWFQNESMASYLNFGAQYVQRLVSAKEANRPNIPFYAFPKTGSSFVTTTLANALDIPFGMTSVESRFAISAWAKNFAAGPGVLHDHLWMDKSNSAVLRVAEINRMIVHIRDPRQVIISVAHHVLESPVTAQIFGDVRVAELQFLSPEDVIQNIIEKERLIPAYGRWLDGWLAERDVFKIMISRYETMNEDIHGFFREILNFCNGDQSAIDAMMIYLENQSEAEHGTNFNFRSGRSDEWKEALDDRQINAITRQLQGTKLGELYNV